MITPLTARLSYSENVFRRKLLDRIVAEGAPVRVADPSESAMVQALTGKGIIVCSSAGEVTFAYPVSALPTPHRVSLGDGRTFHAMCAVDAMGAAFTFGQDVTIESSCGHCRQKVRVKVVGGEIETLEPPGTHVLHLDLRRFRNWAAEC